MGQHFFQRDNLLLSPVPTIIDQNIDNRDLASERSPKFSICLVADEHLHAAPLITLACLLDIDTVDPAPGAKITLPHFEAAPAVNADFNDMDLSAYKLLKMLMID